MNPQQTSGSGSAPAQFTFGPSAEDKFAALEARVTELERLVKASRPDYRRGAITGSHSIDAAKL